MTEPHDIEASKSSEQLLSRAEVIELQRAIEAGLLARDARLSGIGFADATDEELKLLEAAGERARQRFISANLGLVGMVSRQFAARRQLPDAELFQEGCLGFPLVNYLPVAGNALTAPNEGVQREHVNGIGVVQSDGLHILTCASSRVAAHRRSGSRLMFP